MTQLRSPEILCAGEILWDSLPAGLFPGGAPFNVAAQLRALGVPAALVSRVGDDRLGVEAVARAKRQGVATDLIQVDSRLPTGFVGVTVDEEGAATYDIVAPVAWDAIEASEPALERAAIAPAVVFGSLAQRSATSRHAVRRLAAAGTMRVFDVNLRPPHDDAAVVLDSLPGTELVKVNEAELETLAGWLGLPRTLHDAGAALADRFGITTLCVTRGGNGAAMLRDGRWHEHPGFNVAVADTVGAGDAFLAALLRGLLAGTGDEELLRTANLVAAFVASRSGALPALEPETIEKIARHEKGTRRRIGGGSPAFQRPL